MSGRAPTSEPTLVKKHCMKAYYGQAGLSHPCDRQSLDGGAILG